MNAITPVSLLDLARWICPICHRVVWWWENVNKIEHARQHKANAALALLPGVLSALYVHHGDNCFETLIPTIEDILAEDA